MKNENDIETQLKKAISSLILNPEYTFFAYLALNLRLKECPEVGTIATDGEYLYYAPKYLIGRTKKELMALICHEIMHCAYGHIWRRDNRDQIKWNLATDYAINEIISRMTDLELPKGALLEPKFFGMSSEQIYDELNGLGVDNIRRCYCTCNLEYGNQKAKETQSDSEKWGVLVRQALTTAKKAGLLPSGLETLIAEIVRPQINWKSLLRRFIQESVKSDYTWQYPNKRFLALGCYFPVVETKTIPHVVVGCDSSGSVWNRKTQGLFGSELLAIQQENMIEKITVIFCDSRIQKIVELEKGDDFIYAPKGGGGTNFAPVFQWVNSQETSPSCVIYLTDGDGVFPSKEDTPQCPVIWCLTRLTEPTKIEIPFGEVLYIDTG